MNKSEITGLLAKEMAEQQQRLNGRQQQLSQPEPDPREVEEPESQGQELLISTLYLMQQNSLESRKQIAELANNQRVLLQEMTQLKQDVADQQQGQRNGQQTIIRFLVALIGLILMMIFLRACK